MTQLAADLSNALLEILPSQPALIDAVEIGPWFSLRQVRAYRQMLPELPFYFHGADWVGRVGLIPGTISKLAAYLRCTGSPWASLHISLWRPGMVWAMKRLGLRLPPPDAQRAALTFARQVERLACSLQAPIILENIEPLPFAGCDLDAQPWLIRSILENTGCGLLLDTGHARVSAAALGVDAMEYLSSLPLERVEQVHVSGPRLRGGRLADAHEPLLEADYDLLDFVLERTKPKVVTLEYIRESGPLQEQLLRLRGMLANCNRTT